MSSLLIFGAGGHGKVVAEAAAACDIWSDIVFADDLFPGLKQVNEIPVVADITDAKALQSSFTDAIVAVGDNKLRLSLTQELNKCGFNLPVIKHPSAIVAESASIGEGSVLMANSVVQSCAQLGQAVILNTSSSIDHDCEIGNGVHLSPGTHLGGDVRISDFAFLGVGVSVIRGVSIGSNSIIGSGSVVIENIDSDVIAAGVPARKIKSNE